MNKLLDKINARLESRKSGDEGSMLFDVLLGMAIFALIAVIGILSAGKLRERAYVIQATSDAKQVATGIEAYLTGPNATAMPFANGALTAANLASLGVNATSGNTVFLKGGGIGAYTVCALNTSGAYAVYTAASGAITSSGTSGAPSAAGGACNAS